jgi:branched-chain amino acid transport system permease protein
MNLGISPWISMFLAGGISAIFSLIVALPTLRLRGPYVAVVTLSFMLILEQVCYNWTSLTKGPMGLSGIPELTNFNIFGIDVIFDGISRVPYYYVIIIFLIITMGIMYYIVNSKLGLQLKAIRDSEEAAAATGVRITRAKILIFFITSFFAGWVGGFYAHYILLLTPGVFAFLMMASILTSTLIGGWGTLFGPLIGAFILTFLIDFLKNFGDIYHFFYGAFLILIIFFMPKGIIISFNKFMAIVIKRTITKNVVSH